MPVTDVQTQTTDGAPPQGGQPQLPLDGNSAPPAPPVAAPVKPEGLPDRYFDAATGVRLTEVAATLAEVEAERTKAAEAFKDFPEKAEDAGKFYKLPEEMLPEGVKLPDGVKFEPNTALLEAALPILHKHKISPDAFQELTRAFNAYELANYQKGMDEVVADNKKLGTNAAARRKDVGDRLTALDPEAAKFFDANAMTAGAIEMFERLLQKVTTQGNVFPLNGNRDTTPPTPPQKLEDRWYPGGAPQQKAG